MVVFGLFVVAFIVVLELLNVVTSSVVSMYEVTWPAVVVFVFIMVVLGVVVISARVVFKRKRIKNKDLTLIKLLFSASFTNTCGSSRD